MALQGLLNHPWKVIEGEPKDGKEKRKHQEKWRANAILHEMITGGVSGRDEEHQNEL